MATAIETIWSSAERQAWTVEHPLTCSEWVEKNRQIARGLSNIPGPWRNENAPYLRGPMDLANAKGIVQINIIKAGQIGISEGFRNEMLYWAAQDPDPMAVGFPDKLTGRKVVMQRIIPAFRNCEALEGYFGPKAWDIKAEQIKLTNGFLLNLMWAGSPAAMATDPYRRVINDEVDKAGFRDWGGAEPNPIGRTWKRLRSYGDRKLQVNISTPTTRLGPIWRLWEESTVKLIWCVPCPKCGKFQELAFRNLRWKKPKKKELSKSERLSLAAKIEANNAVWYQCAECGKKIDPDDKTTMVRAGRWSSVDGSIKDAEKVKRWPRGTRIGMKISALPCLWESWGSIAAEFLRAKGDRAKTYVFRTETLGEVWEDQLEKPEASIFSRKSVKATLEEGIVPAWAIRLLGTIDTQHDHFYVVIRAWGCDMKSARVFHARAENFSELDTLLWKTPWPVERSARAPMIVDMTLIDSGGTKLEGEQASRTMAVYRWATQRKGMVRPIKGASTAKRQPQGVYFWPGRGVLNPTGQGRPKGKKAGKEIRIWFLDTDHLADLMTDQISAGTTEEDARPEQWLLNKADDDDYNLQLSNMHKITIATKAGLEERWMPVESGAANHYWDCEVYQIAAAYMARVHLLPPRDEVDRMLRERARQQEDRSAEEKTRRGGRSQDKGSGAWDVTGFDDYL